MSVTTPLPTPPNSITRAATFNSDTDGFLASLALFQSELNSYASSLSAFGRNLLINGSFDVNQRAPATNADDTYAHDRWNILTQTATVACTTLGPAIENGYNKALEITQSQASAQRFGFSQIIEGINCKHLRGNSATLSGRVRCSATTTIRYAILGWTGTEDTVTSDVVNDWTNATFTAGNFFLASNVAVLGTGSIALTANTWTNLTALTASLGTAFNNLVVLIWTDSTQAQNVTLDCDYLQLEAGAAATPFEKRSYGHTLNLCQRYFRKFGSGDVNDVFGTGQAFSTTQAEFQLLYDEMRAAPTGTVSGNTDFQIYNASKGSIFATTIVTVGAPTKKALRLSTTIGSANLAAGNAAQLYAVNTSAAIKLDAEL